MSVITISRQFGSGGNEIAELICATTGYQLFEKHILAQAAFDVGLSEKEIIEFSEDHFKTDTLFDRMFGRSRPVASVRYWRETKDGVRLPDEIELDQGHALLLVQKAIETAYRIGNMVIVGRGGQMVLKDRTDVLHVRIEAPLEDRLLRVRALPRLASRTYADSVEARRVAQDLIGANDLASADYLKRVYHVDWSDSSLYHVVINTGKLRVEQAAGVILEALHQLEQQAVKV